MTVAELIEHLKTFDSNLQVCTCDQENGTCIVVDAKVEPIDPPANSNESNASRHARARPAVVLWAGDYASDVLFPEEVQR
jgi:hypothetical protein